MKLLFRLIIILSISQILFLYLSFFSNNSDSCPLFNFKTETTCFIKKALIEKNNKISL